MSTTPQPLTDEQIRTALESQIKHYLKFGRELAILEKALLDKGLLTEADIDQARKEVDLEGKEHLAKIGEALRQGPAGGIQ